MDFKHARSATNLSCPSPTDESSYVGTGETCPTAILVINIMNNLIYEPDGSKFNSRRMAVRPVSRDDRRQYPVLGVLQRCVRTAVEINKR